METTASGDAAESRASDDLSPSHAALEALERSAEQYRLLYMSIDEGLCIIELLLDADGNAADYRFLEMNPAFVRQTGLADALGRTVRELLPEHEEFWFETYGRIARTGVAMRFEHEARALGRFYDVYAFRIGDPALHRVAVLFNDISERKRAQERKAFLLQLSDTLRPLSDAVAVQRAAMQCVGHYLGAHRALYSEVLDDADTLVAGPGYVSGVPEMPDAVRLSDFGEAVTSRFRRGEVIVIDDIEADDRWSADFHAAFASIGVRAAVGLPLLKSDRLVAVLAVHQAVPRAWDAEEIALLKVVAERTWDAVERSRAEAALRDADRRKDEFLATLAHELRNPLAPIRNALRLLRSDPARVDAEGLRAVIERQVEHMMHLVEDLLDVARIGRGIVELRRDVVDLRKVLQMAIETSLPAIERGRHALTFQMPGEPLPIDGDAVRLAQIYANLLNNAAKYSDDGSRIVLAAEREGDEVVVRVQDDGIGIPAEQLPHVFELFGQVERHRDRAQGGLGIGLHLAQRLARMHGGSIQAASAGVGCGSIFTVRLPIASQADAAAGAAPPDQGVDLRGLEVLVVDDNRDNADTLAILLELEGARPQTAYDGLSALAMLEHSRPSVVLLDLGMPGLDGLSTARRIRADPRFAGTTLVALTGRSQDGDRAETRAAGFDHHLIKPVEPDALLKLLTGIAARGAVIAR